MKVKIVTLGCKVNHYDSQSILQNLIASGYESASEDMLADVYIINTCAVTNESERKSRQTIRRCRHENPNAVIVMTGCVSEISRDDAGELPYADIVTGTQNRDAIPALIDEFVRTRQNQRSFAPTDNLTQGVTQFEGRTRATLKIQDGCRMYCTYCIIPYARNRVCSMPKDSIIEAVKQITHKGYREAVLTGIHLASYLDDKGARLIDVLESIDRETSLTRLRIGSLEPKLLSEQFLDRLSRVKCFCPHFHISLQSGSNEILRKMNRHYSKEEYFEIVRFVRERFPGAMITTDIIVGFPGETEELFQETSDFVREIRFSHVHVFPFSPKKGTPAAEYPKQLTKKVKHERTERLIALSEEIKQEIFAEQIGTVQEVLGETLDEQGHVVGYTRNYLKTAIRGGAALHECNNVRIVSYDSERLIADKIIDSLV